MNTKYKRKPNDKFPDNIILKLYFSDEELTNIKLNSKPVEEILLACALIHSTIKINQEPIKLTGRRIEPIPSGPEILFKFYNRNIF